MRRMFFIFTLCFTIFMTGYSVYLAAREAKPVQANILTVGTPRITVLGELGKPLESIVKPNGRSDIFSLNYEYETKHRENLKVREARLFAVGLRQFADTSARADLDDKIYLYKIDYDAVNRVTRVSKHAMKPGEEFQFSSYEPPAQVAELP